MAFTEQGLQRPQQPRAIQVNIQIMRAFAAMRELMQTHAELKQKIDAMEAKYDEQFQIVFEAIKALMEPDEEEGSRTRIGF